MEDSQARVEKTLKEGLEECRKSSMEINRAISEGSEIVSVFVEETTKQGDIIPVESLEEEENKTADARVLLVSSWIGFDQNKIIKGTEAVCVILRPNEIETAEGFIATYGEEEEEEEIEDPLVEDSECVCGANLQMCEKNQHIFGGHLQDYIPDTCVESNPK
jgi:hypothetical protein